MKINKKPDIIKVAIEINYTLYFIQKDFIIQQYIF